MKKLSLGIVFRRLFLFDILMANIIYFVVSLADGGFYLTSVDFTKNLVMLLVSVPAFILVFYLFRIHRTVWRYAGIREFKNLGVYLAVSSSLSLLLLFVFTRSIGLSIVAVLLFLSTCVCVCCFARLYISVKAVKVHSRQVLDRLRDKGDVQDFGKTLIVGAGSAAKLLMREIREDAFFAMCTPVCFVDDDQEKQGMILLGITIEGTCADIPELCKKHSIKTIFLAIPSLPTQRRQEILSICLETGAAVHSLPSVRDIAKGKGITVNKVRIEDLLEREPIKIELEKVMDYVKDKTILVTGAGGSIGSELSRQIASYPVKKLILFDIYENGVYELLCELKKNYPDLVIEALIGSVRDENRLREVFEETRPDIVYHAAAHKHVPLMEDSPKEAIKNNVLGTFNTVLASDRAGVQRFVLISTDKAVNPTNVMGATKRMCEMLIQAYNKKSRTEYVAVRFGNVLGSNGSVVPLFERQIAAGGPITVTHPDIIRYFMTIPEAARLVLQAGATASGGEIFVLDMGKPVKIADLAKNMIRLSGLEPERDIKIVYTGLRPGEKLYEELLMDEEGISSTENELIHIGRPIDFDEDKFLSRMNGLREEIKNENFDARLVIRELVPTFISPEEANGKQIGN